MGEVGGKRTGPAAIEALVVATGKVAEVAVIGIIAIPKKTLDADAAGRLRADLSAAVVAGMGRAYRPRHILFVPDLPRTRSMKIMRRMIRSILLCQPPGDLSSLANPETLTYLEAVKPEVD
ncbi:MAG: hypothetical protein O2967_09165 [Proteobacteria bacterium]|nr:hypothetical protein [Pseudomonadota bacterium]